MKPSSSFYFLLLCFVFVSRVLWSFSEVVGMKKAIKHYKDGCSFPVTLVQEVKSVGVRYPLPLTHIYVKIRLQFSCSGSCPESRYEQGNKPELRKLKPSPTPKPHHCCHFAWSSEEFTFHTRSFHSHFEHQVDYLYFQARRMRSTSLREPSSLTCP